MFNLIAQWRVGRAFVDRGDELTLAIGYEVIWRSRRGWVTSKARGMLLGKRSMGGSRRIVPPARAVNYVSNKLKEAAMTSRHEEQKLRRSLLNSTTAMTYHAAAALHETLDGGAGIVIGSTEIVPYPSASAPWNTSLPPEAPLSYAIDAVEPVGEVHEIAKSLDAAPVSSPGAAASEVEVALPPADATAPPPASMDTGGGATFRLRRRL
jgi:hypothetical protein